MTALPACQAVSERYALADLSLFAAYHHLCLHELMENCTHEQSMQWKEQLRRVLKKQLYKKQLTRQAQLALYWRWAQKQ